ncbi:unnamed protein product [Rhizoctonia solani]|uniref:Uncharacterized protein n=1 Tax=Rhizoctonia solani TaxID=456999 RepID=A0A8H3A481_9AGAM|nr:unnamed protein product [Rhizoctonia solani]
MSVPGNSTLASAISSLAPTPSITNSALIGSSNDNKPSTAAIVVPLAIFAVALAGLLFSLRQRSKTKEIQGQKNEPALNRVTTKASCASGSSASSSGSSRADLERAMEFLAGIRVPASSRLTPLPPSIESKRRERRETRMRQPSMSFREDMAPERASIPTISSVPEMDQRTRRCDEPLPPLPIISQSDPEDVYPQHEVPRSATYPVAQGHSPGVLQETDYRNPIEQPVHPSTHSFGPSSGIQADLSQVAASLSVTDLHVNHSLKGMPRPPCFAQRHTYAIPSSTLQPAMVTGSSPHPVSLTPVLATNSAIPSCPDSLRVALSQPLPDPVPKIVVNPVYSGYAELNSQPETKCEPVDQSLTRPRPAIPYSTRPQASQSQVNTMNPYDAIAKALRTPRLEQTFD